MDKQIFYSRSKIYLRDKKLTILQNRLPSFLFGWERLANSYPYFGFWINQEFNDFKVLEVSDYFNKRRNEIACGFQESEDGWLFWDKEGQLDFNNDNCLVYIIPSRLESKALELTHLLINLFNDMEVCYYSMIDGGTFRV
jgi:hypothetical protein